MGMEFLRLDCAIVNIVAVKRCYSFTGHYPQSPLCML